MPTWVRLADVSGAGRPTGIVVPTSVIGKWAPGAEILITSHTINYNDQQVRKITNITSINGGVLLGLNMSINRPTTLKDSADFAVEVALLSRNIVFEGSPDPINALHGGHFMVFRTPSVLQVIEGVEFVRFGQQGNLGRYPLHFHFCGDVSGSIVSKNTIRQSNQRCVVVHGTNNLLVQENVAFDTKGHCFMLEDGIETNNMFIRNLGAFTDAVTTIIPNLGTNGKETDDKPATFWVTNPTNTWEGNVAAGSAGSGYWFQLVLRGDRASQFPGLNPQTQPMTLFKDNVAHSNRGVRLDCVGRERRKLARARRF
jgi:hypothetical protein